MDDRLTDEEVQRLLAAPRARHHGNGSAWRHAVRDELILWLMVHAGLRSSEVPAMHCAHLVNAFGLIMVPGAGEQRMVRPTEELPAALEDHVKGIQQERRSLLELSEDQVRRLVPRYGQLAGIRRELAARTLRCTFAGNVFKRHPSLPALARALGVGTVRTAAQYLNPELIGELELAAS